MSDEIELHDSRLAVECAAEAIVLRLCPAYVHHWAKSSSGWRGEGRRQSAEIVISRGSIARRPAEAIHEVSGGWLECGARRYQNMIPVPFEHWGPVRGRLELMNAEAVDVQGDGMSVRLVGEPEFLEALPPEWAPSEDAV